MREISRSLECFTWVRGNPLTPGMCHPAKPCELTWYREGPEVLNVHGCSMYSYLVISCHISSNILSYLVISCLEPRPMALVAARSPSNNYSQHYHERRQLYELNFSRHFVTLALRVPCFRSRKEHSWTDVFSESIGIAGQQVCPLTQGLQHVSVRSHSTSFHFC